MGSDATLTVAESEFDLKILRAPVDKVIVVDFGAAWSDPCRQLDLILEKVISSSADAAVLAKVDIDENPGLADRFEVVGIPTVKVFRGGQIVAEFVGAYPEEEVRALLAPCVPSKADRFVADADALLAGGSLTMAGDLYESALKADPNHSGAKFGLAQVRLHRNEFDHAEALLKMIDEGAPEFGRAQALLGQAGLARHCQTKGGVKACVERLANDPTDPELRFDNACCLAAAGKHDEALDELLRIMSENKNLEWGSALNPAVRIFSLLGAKNPVADEYRRRLSSVLY